MSARKRGSLTWLTGLLLATSPVLAETKPAPASAALRIYTRNTSFKLPVQVDDDVRARITVLRLFVKGPDGVWACQESGPPTQTAFSFRAPRDGEYRFLFATVDRAGRQYPADPEAVAPHRVVVVDTQPPQVSVQSTAGPSGEALLRCLVIDANPDPATVRVSCRTPSGGWCGLESVPGDGTLFRAPSPSDLQGLVRVEATDRAGNSTNREFNLGAMAAEARPPGSASSAPVELTLAKRTMAKAPPLLTEQPPGEPGKLPPLPDAPPAKEVGGPLLELAPIARAPQSHEALPVGVPDPKDEILRLPLAPPSSIEPVPDAAASPKPAERSADKIALPPPPATLAPADTKLIASTRCSLEYALEGVQPAAVGKVEFWATRDHGKTWQRVPDESNGRSPAQLVLPGDGVYGIAIRSGGNRQPPAGNDTPDCWVEVDTTKPFVNLLPPTVGTGAEAGTVLILWTAHDKNLAADSVALAYATQPGGSWQPIVTGHKNEGVYRWVLPPDIGGQVYLRLEVSDRAGNVGRAELQQPVMLDTGKPRVKVLAIGPAGK
jgi:hypothetical protein